ncbi:MAG: AMP-binding protein, partial [bacterium]|nr:AMP-binding protein [bacterium]
LPIDPGMPRARVRFMLADASVNVMVTTAALAQEVDGVNGSDVKRNLETLLIDSHRLPDPAASYRLDVSTSPSSLAYVIYTSGSTGFPKGVMVQHQSAVNFITGMTSGIAFSPAKTILAITSISFDIFFLETLLPLTCGMKVVIANEKQRKNPALITAAAAAEKINMLQFTPSMLQLFITLDEWDVLSGVEELIVGGEVFPVFLFKQVNQGFTGNIYNVYGPTETTIWSTLKDLTNCQPGELSIGT